MILACRVDCIIYDAQSLKEKRAVLQRIMTRLSQRFNLAVSEIDFQDQWQRTRLGMVTISSSKKVAENEVRQALALIDSFPEIERAKTELEWL